MSSPTDEQQNALDLFSKGGTLRIDAFAGTGKTTTLRFLALSTQRRGHYLAFNKSTATEAQQRFPQLVKCSTNHSLAYRATRSQYGYSEDKMGGKANANLIADCFGLPEYIQATNQLVLTRRSYAAALQGAMRRFLYSEDDLPGANHFPRIGKFGILNREQFAQFTSNSLPDLQRLWEEMQAKHSRIPLGHDGYLKLWSLGRPRIYADYVMLDEAQDSNPVLLKVLREQPCQMIYVGDPYQQIYEWRGAVNAMQHVKTEHHAVLTQSFRFGQIIAEAATKVVTELGAKIGLRGTPTISSHICPVHPLTILCRTNAGVISNLMVHQGNGASTHVVGGTFEQQKLLEEVKRLKRGISSELPEFYGFANWQEVVQYVEQERDEGLRLLVNLVTRYGEDQLLQALRNCVAEEKHAHIIVSTAHKAKGREWKVVQVDSDFDAAFKKNKQSEEHEQNKWDLDAEGRLFYVAMTRASEAVELPSGAMDFFGIENSRSERFGTPYAAAPRPAVRSAAVGTKRPAAPYARPAPPVQKSSLPQPGTPPPEPGPLGKFLRALFGK